MTFCILLSVTQSMANCPDGIIIKGNIGTYCKSKVNLNWITSFSWCKSQGMQLATWEEACPGSPINSSRCPNLEKKSEGWAWIATPKDPSLAFLIRFEKGVMVDTARSHTAYALCK